MAHEAMRWPKQLRHSNKLGSTDASDGEASFDVSNAHRSFLKDKTTDAVRSLILSPRFLLIVFTARQPNCEAQQQPDHKSKQQPT